ARTAPRPPPLSIRHVPGGGYARRFCSVCVEYHRADAELGGSGMKRMAAVVAALTMAATVLVLSAPSPVAAATVPDPISVVCATTTACWSTMTTTNPGTNNTLSGVSCTAANACVAVGTYDNGLATQTLAWETTTSYWSTMTTTNPGASDSLTGVSCTSANACVAVGTYDNGSAYQTLAEQWNGSEWSTMTTTNPASTSNDIL